MNIRAIQYDITKIKVDAIVNAANYTLLGGGGVDGMIHYCAGPRLKEECATLGGCEKGEAKITKGYDLPAKYVIHTVGPVYGHENGLEENILRNCYTNSLLLAKNNNIKTLAFPAISTGCYKYPKDQAAKIAIETVREFSEKNPDVLDEVIFVLFDQLSYIIYSSIIEKGAEINLQTIDEYNQIMSE